ncbi:TonB-dependent receptor [Tsuneonella sp. CC-YZS046]|uniref:TonB-dependent receptor n=1 Tax=Tsuneonella sp. CC-YZS046 TaxID=3042152 RepID=UPI002D768647|nr:TonB-dependent receptor [Tsuneonella sp. CC-YZS046]WRO66693.1 TonB-dependent receptor [Tsuneonella sp. CC-YZS046]
MKAIAAVSVFALAAGIAAPAFAQQSESGSSTGGLEEIVVTATKRSENLQDVPVAVSAISSSALQAKGVFETSDLNGSMPNLQVSSPYGSQQPNFSLRGVGVGTEYNANAASPVGVYVDEVYQAFRASHGQQLYDLEQVEVVRGPQGTLYGRNTTGGAINFITRKPDLEGTNGQLTLGYGNYDRYNAEGAVEFTPVTDKIGIRLAGTYVNSDPYIHNRLPAGLNTWAAGGASGLNLATGRDPGGVESYGIRGTLRVKPSDRLDISLKGYYAKAKGGAEGPLPTGQDRNSDVIDYNSPNFLLGGLFQALGPNGAGILPASYSQSGNGLGVNELEADTIGTAITRAEGAVLTVKAELTDSLNLTSISGYDSGRYLNSPTDCDGTPFRGCSIGYESNFNAFNQDVRLDYGDGPFKMIVGAYYGRDSITADNRPDFFNSLRDVNAAFGALGAYDAIPGGWQSYFNPAGGFNGTALSASSLPTGITATQHFKQVRKSWAIYGEGSFEVTPTLKLTGGLRYTIDKNAFKDGLTTYYDDAGVARMLSVSAFEDPYFLENVYDEAGNIVIPSFADLGIPVPEGLERRGKSKKLSGRAILDWKPVDNVMMYASYSRGYRAGTFNGLAYGSSAQVYFVDPEEVNAYEIGFKTRFFDNRLQINGALFYYDYMGQQGQVVDNTATANLISLDGTLKGLELDVQFAATDRLKLSASLGLLDSKYKGYDQAACAALDLSGQFPAQDGSCVQSSGGNVSVGGNPFPYAAKSSINLAFDWDALDIGEGTIRVHGDASYTGRFYYDAYKDYSRGVLPTVATGKFTQGEGDYWVLNGRVTYDAGRYSLSVWGKNLTNETYYPFGISIENLFGNGYRARAQPRTYGVEATFRF